MRPFPEEINRKIAGVICDIHFAPTKQARDNLLREGIDEESIFVTGNTAIDALFMTVREDYVFKDPVLNSIGLSDVNFHRKGAQCKKGSGYS